MLNNIETTPFSLGLQPFYKHNNTLSIDPLQDGVPAMKAREPFSDAVTFLHRLGQGRKEFQFRAIPESPTCIKRRARTRKVKGTFDQCKAELVKLNKAGYGIFVTINETDGEGEKAGNIIRATALWQDDDGKLGNDTRYPDTLTPDMVVETSPGNFHRYNFITPTRNLEKWEAAQDLMVERLGSDPSCQGRARILRVPDFFHQKGKPFRIIQIVGENNAAQLTSSSVIKAMLEGTSAPERGTAKGNSTGKKQTAEDYLQYGEVDYSKIDGQILEDLSRALQVIPNHIYADWIKVGHALKGLEKVGFKLWVNWSKGQDYENYSQKDCQAKWKTFGKPNSDYRTIFRMAIDDYGWGTPEKVSQYKDRTFTFSSVGASKKKGVNWLWEGYLPRGKLVLIAGEPGVGKGIVTTDFIATITKGRHWPDETTCPVGEVLYLSSEDDLEDTLHPRLEAAGADVNKVFVPDNMGLNLSEDLPTIRDFCLGRPDLSAIVIDPINSYVGGKNIDGNSDIDVRRVLNPLAEIAQELGVVVICVTHFSKARGRKAMEKVLGSTAYVGLSRVAIAVIRGVDFNDAIKDEDVRVLSPMKNNLKRRQNGWMYAITDKEVEVENPYAGGMMMAEHPAVEWGESTYKTTDEILEANQKPRDQVHQEAKEWLLNLLADGEWMDAAKIETLVKEEAGFSNRTYERVRKELRDAGSIETRKCKVERRQWQWRKVKEALLPTYL